MSFLQIIGAIYGFGALFVLFGIGLHVLASLVVSRPIKKTLRVLPRLVLILLLIGIAWPWMIFTWAPLREIFVEVGRIAIPFGYLFSALMTAVYPWVWAWYISFILLWFLLERYHYKAVKQA